MHVNVVKVNSVHKKVTPTSSVNHGQQYFYVCMCNLLRICVMAALSIISYLIKKQRYNEVELRTADYQLLTSHEVQACGTSKTKVVGMVLHVSKASNFALSKKIGEKKVKRPVTNYRLVFCR